MAAEGLSPALEELVAHHLDSMEQAEVLLLLRKHADRSWTPEAAAAELRIDPGSVAQRLGRLEAGGLAAREAGGGGGYRYAPRTAALGSAVDELAVAYNERPVTLVRLIYSRPQAPSALQSFADAFRIRKPDKPGG